MASQLDRKYDQVRRGLITNQAIATERLWLHRDLEDRFSFLSPVMKLVDSVSAAYVALLSSYFNIKSQQVTGSPANVDLNPENYTANVLRPEEPAFPNSAFGYYITKLEEGKDSKVAEEMAGRYLMKSVKTHDQMIQVRAAEDWVEEAGDTPIVGYRRVIHGETCDHCRLAAERLYFRGDLAPIHHGCDCGVGPVFEGEDHGLFTLRKKLVPIKQDPTLGPVVDQSVDVQV